VALIHPIPGLRTPEVRSHQNLDSRGEKWPIVHRIDASPSPSPVARWFREKFITPTPAQLLAWPRIRAGKDVLIVSPTGTGKTFAAFHQVLDELSMEHATGCLAESLQCLYLSPLRALSYDLEKNLQQPLREIYGSNPPIRVGLRTGDTEPNERVRQFQTPPHVLLTTPESLSLLLSQPKWTVQLSRIRWVIVDEIHALAENKRGAMLSLALERLDSIVLSCRPNGKPVQRIGLSATVHPTDLVARYLTGTRGSAEIIDGSADKQIELRVYTPLKEHPYPMAGFSGIRMIAAMGKLIRRHRTTLVFTNTRSGAESTTYWLRENLPDLAEQIECHHASLDRDVRVDVEDRLKMGHLRCVVCSTSLELGIDIGSIDLVVMLATPKGVSKALQRTGRAGHSIHETSRGLLMATNVHDLVECAATARLARRKQLDSVRISPGPLDVLAQFLVGLGCHGDIESDWAYRLVRQALPYEDLSRKDFDDVLDYLAGGGRSLRQQYTEVFGKIVIDESGNRFETRAGATRRDFLQNIGTIPTEGVVRVLHRNTSLGTVEESFIRQLRIGDVFMLSGRPVRLERMGVLEAWVSRAEGSTPTVPRWGANKMPLSNRVGSEIRSFRSELRKHLEEIPFHLSPSLIPWIAERLECERPNAAIIFRIHAAQHQVSEIPTADFLLIECLLEGSNIAPNIPKPKIETKRSREPMQDRQLSLEILRKDPRMRWKGNPAESPSQQTLIGTRLHYFFHSLIGRSANDALSRVVALRLSKLRGGNAVATPDDYGFVLTVSQDQRIVPGDLPVLLSVADFRNELETSLSKSELLKYHFRNAAQTGLIVYRNYFGEQKSVRKLQWSSEVIFNVLTDHEPDHVLLREARKETLFSHLDADGAEEFLKDLANHQRPIRLKSVEDVPPLSFGMYATQIKEALTVEDPTATLERLYHLWWAKIEGGIAPADV
jgi:ATP-dependent helicase Lhr and Lhr-like helicase